MGLLCFISINPVAWPSVLMRYSNNSDIALFYRPHQLVWKLVPGAFPYITSLYGERMRKLGYSQCGLLYLLL